MTTKQYPLIPIEDGYIMVDKERRPKIAEYQYCYEDYFPIVRDEDEEYEADVNNYGTVIAHTGIPSLKESGLPLIEIPSKAALEWEKQGDKEVCSKMDRQFWVDGYKAAGGLHTEEDMLKMFEAGRTFGFVECGEGYGVKYEGNDRPKDAATYLQSLKKRPIAVVVGGYFENQGSKIIGATPSGEVTKIGNYLFKPKVVNGYIQIREVIYDNH